MAWCPQISICLFVLFSCSVQSFSTPATNKIWGLALNKRSQIFGKSLEEELFPLIEEEHPRAEVDPPSIPIELEQPPMRAELEQASIIDASLSASSTSSIETETTPTDPPNDNELNPKLMKVSELREHLNLIGLNSVGLKSELVERMENYLKTKKSSEKKPTLKANLPIDSTTETSDVTSEKTTKKKPSLNLDEELSGLFQSPPLTQPTIDQRDQEKNLAEDAPMSTMPNEDKESRAQNQRSNSATPNNTPPTSITRPPGRSPVFAPDSPKVDPNALRYIQCSKCKAVYNIQLSDFTLGKKVMCSLCNHTWWQSPSRINVLRPGFSLKDLDEDMKARYLMASTLPRVEMGVFVRNIHFEDNEETIAAIFRPYGTVERVAVMRHSTGLSKGYAFVSMSNNEEEVNAIQNLNGLEITGRVLHVSKAV